MSDQTFWVGLYADADVVLPEIDTWKTGERVNGTQSRVFALRAADADCIHDLLAELLCGGSYVVRFIERRDYRTYGDFAGKGTRCPMAAKYLGDPIDSVAEVRKRTGIK